MKRWTITLASLTLLLSPLAAYAQDDPAKGAAKLIEFFRAKGLITAAILIGAAIFLLRLIGGLTERLGKRFTEHRLLAQQVSTILRFAIYMITIVLLIRSTFTLDRDTMLALTGTIAVGAGFALKDLAASVLAGITILFDRPFQVGDRVTFAGLYGEIRTIGLRTVRMVTLDDSVVTIPNNKFLTDVVVSGNAGALDMQIVMDFYVAQDTDIARAKRIVSEALRTSRFVFLQKPVVVLVNDLIHESYLVTRLRGKAYVHDVRHEKAFETDVTERVKRAFTEAEIAHPALHHQGARLVPGGRGPLSAGAPGASCSADRPG